MQSTLAKNAQDIKFNLQGDTTQYLLRCPLGIDCILSENKKVYLLVYFVKEVTFGISGF